MQSNAPVSVSRLTTLHDLVRALPKHADKPAIVALSKSGADVWSYAILGDQAPRLAAGLIGAGLRRGDSAALLAGNRPEWMLACLAVIEAGGVAVSLDAQLGEEALARVLQDSAARFLFTTGEELPRIRALCAEAGLTVILLDAEPNDSRSWRRLLAEEPAVLPEPDPDETAALFYTSGSTGSAKGVPLSHRNLVFQINAIIEAKLVTDVDRLLLPLPLHHVYAFAIGMLVPFALGLPVVLPHSLTGPQIVRAMREGGVTAVLGVPRLYDALCAAIDARIESGPVRVSTSFKTLLRLSLWLRRRLGLRAGKLLFRPLHREFGRPLRIMACGGAALAPELAWKLEALGWQVAVGYGLTETSPLLTLNPPGSARIGTVGRPLPGIEIRIAPPAPRSGENELHPTESNLGGEILARGPNVFTGYRNLPAKTAEAFTADGWFRTGDLGFFDDGGDLHITGRASTLIVMAGGENIQPEDLEAAFQKSPAISEVGILQKESRLVAVIVPQLDKIHASGEAAVAAAIREAVRSVAAALPSYQRLSDFVLTRDGLARTRLGKIRRHLLIERYDQELARRAGAAVAGPIPRDQMSLEDLALVEQSPARQVWKMLAARYPDKRLTPGASPQLDLGFDSLEWLNLSLEIRERTGVELTEQAIGGINTVRDLLHAVTAAKAGGRDLPLLDQPEAVLSPEQRRWLEPPSALVSLIMRGGYAFNTLLCSALFHLQVKGLENLPVDKPFALTPNHLSYLDPQVVAAALRYRLLRRTYWGGWTGIMTTNPFNRLFSRWAQVIPIDPDHAVISSLAFGAAVLKRGNNLVWFPEGGISRTGALQPFKPGIGLLLNRYPTLAVPVAIHGTREAMPLGKLIPKASRITVEFGRPIHSSELEQEGQGSTPNERIVCALHSRLAGLQTRSSQSHP